MAETRSSGCLGSLGQRAIDRRREHRELRPGARPVDARPQPSHDGNEVLIRRQILRIGDLRRHRSRDPDVRAPRQSTEVGGHDADDGERHAVETNRAIGREPLAAEPALPQPLIDDGDRRRTRGVVVCLDEDAAAGRHGSEHGQVLRRHPLAVHELGVAVVSTAGHRERRGRKRPDRVKALLGGAQLFCARERPSLATRWFIRRIAFEKENADALGVRKGRLAPQRRAHDRERRRQRGHTEGERRDDGDRKRPAPGGTRSNAKGHRSTFRQLLDAPGRLPTGPSRPPLSIPQPAR